MNVAELSVIMVFGIPIVAIIGGIFLSALKIIKGDSKGKTKEENINEARLIQEMYQSLSRMEARIESLETIIFDKMGKSK